MTVHRNIEGTNNYVHCKYVVILYCIYMYVYMYNYINYFTGRCQLW